MIRPPMQRYTPRDILVLALIGVMFVWYYGQRSTGGWESFLLLLVALLPAITFHEFSHAFVAMLLGDRTAHSLGRVSLNPIRHLDLWGSLAFLFFHFGWGKPVPINPNNMKGVSPLVGAAIATLAGPSSNVLLAFFASLPLQLGIVRSASMEGQFLVALVTINVTLAAFNFLPIPPLDGFSLARLVLPYNVSFLLEQYGMFLLIALIFIPQILGRQYDIITRLTVPIERFIYDLIRFSA
jgi:Zn-dependent protease